MKGLPPSEGPRSRRARGRKSEPIELDPIADEPDDFEIIDQHSRPTIRQEIEQLRAELAEDKSEPIKCGRCYGQGLVAGSRFCGDTRQCPDCKGSGEREPTEEEIAQREAAAAKRADQMQEILPGDVDYKPKPKRKAARRMPAKPKMPGTLAGERRRKKPRRKAAKKKPAADDIPPWEKLGDDAAPWD